MFTYWNLCKKHAFDITGMDLYSSSDNWADSFFSDMTNQQLMDQGNQLIDETDQAIARSKQVNTYLWPASELIVSFS